MAELLSRKPLFQGKDYVEMLKLQIAYIGEQQRKNKKTKTNPGQGLRALLCLDAGNVPRALTFENVCQASHSRSLLPL